MKLSDLPRPFIGTSCPPGFVPRSAGPSPQMDAGSPGSRNMTFACVLGLLDHGKPSQASRLTARSVWPSASNGWRRRSQAVFSRSHPRPAGPPVNASAYPLGSPHDSGYDRFATPFSSGTLVGLPGTPCLTPPSSPLTAGRQRVRSAIQEHLPCVLNRTCGLLLWH
jgi:hypothetical protein